MIVEDLAPWIVSIICQFFQWCKGKCDPLQSGWNSKSKHDKYFRIFQSAAYWDSSAHGWQRSQIYWWSPSMVTQSPEKCPSRYKKSWFFNVHIYSVKSAQSPHFSGDFWYPVLMFEDLPLDDFEQVLAILRLRSTHHWWSVNPLWRHSMMRRYCFSAGILLLLMSTPP